MELIALVRRVDKDSAYLDERFCGRGGVASIYSRVSWEASIEGDGKAEQMSFGHFRRTSIPS